MFNRVSASDSMRLVNMDPEIVLGLNDPLTDAALVKFRQTVSPFKMNPRVFATSTKCVAHYTATTAVV